MSVEVFKLFKKNQCIWKFIDFGVEFYTIKLHFNNRGYTEETFDLAKM